MFLITSFKLYQKERRLTKTDLQSSFVLNNQKYFCVVSGLMVAGHIHGQKALESKPHTKEMPGMRWNQSPISVYMYHSLLFD